MEVKILSYKIKPKEFEWYVMLVNSLICVFTWSKYWHTSIVIGDYKHESGHPNGAKKSLYIHKEDPHIDVDTYFVNEDQVKDMEAFAESMLERKLPYNYKKLAILAICYPTKFIWDKIKWVPFQDDKHGMVCSVYVREIVIAGKMDYWEHRYKENMAPVDFRRK